MRAHSTLPFVDRISAASQAESRKLAGSHVRSTRDDLLAYLIPALEIKF